MSAIWFLVLDKMFFMCIFAADMGSFHTHKDFGGETNDFPNPEFPVDLQLKC